MTQLRCLRAELLLERRASGLSAAESLRLEEHLASCEHCSEQARLLGAMRELLDKLDTSLQPEARERAIVGAISGARAVEGAASPLTAMRPRTLVAAVALAAALGLALGLGLRARRADQASSRSLDRAASVSPNASQLDRVLSGRIELAGRVQGEGTALAETSSIRAPEAASVALGQAKVELRPGTRLSWQRNERRLRLEAGSVLADVDPSAHRSFTVETPDFTVLVLGTRFEVSLEGVNVERGRVRVLAKDGHALSPDLGPGARFTFTPSPPAPETAGSDEHSLSAAHERARAPSVKAPLRPAAVPTRGDAVALLDAARAELGAKRVTPAREQIDAALALGPAADLRAEAMSLRAECSLVEGDLGAAVTAYLHVAHAFPELPAGENASFAAARLEADRGRGAAAARALARYLARYPHGRFTKEARLRLDELSAASDRTR